MAFAAAAAEAGGNFLSTLGSSLFSYFMQGQQFDQQKQLLQMQLTNQTELQNSYQAYMLDLTEHKFENQKELNIQNLQLKGMNTPSALMASHNSSITSSLGNNNYPTGDTVRLGTSAGRWVNEQGMTSTGAQASLNINPTDSSTSTGDQPTQRIITPTSSKQKRAEQLTSDEWTSQPQQTLDSIGTTNALPASKSQMNSERLDAFANNQQNSDVSEIPTSNSITFDEDKDNRESDV